MEANPSEVNISGSTASYDKNSGSEVILLKKMNDQTNYLKVKTKQFKETFNKIIKHTK